MYTPQHIWENSANPGFSLLPNPTTDVTPCQTYTHTKKFGVTRKWKGMDLRLVIAASHPLFKKKT